MTEEKLTPHERGVVNCALRLLDDAKVPYGRDVENFSEGDWQIIIEAGRRRREDERERRQARLTESSDQPGSIVKAALADLIREHIKAPPDYPQPPDGEDLHRQGEPADWWKLGYVDALKDLLLSLENAHLHQASKPTDPDSPEDPPSGSAADA